MAFVANQSAARVYDVFKGNE